MAKFVVNGKEYDSVEDMPPAERETYLHMRDMFEDKNNNGVPDIMDMDMDELFADKNKDGIPDLLEKGTRTVVRTETRTFSHRDLSEEEAQRIMSQAMGGGDASDSAGFRSSDSMPSVPQWDVPRAKSRPNIKRLVILLVVFDLLVVGGVLAWMFWVQ